jgi:hypothetical protein
MAIEPADRHNEADQQPRQPARPIPESYWVLPGRLLAGEYPGARDQGVAQRKVQRLLQAGITCFIDLTEPNEGQLRPYWPHVLAAMSEGSVQMEHQRWPIRDMGVPAHAHMIGILQAIDQALVRNHIVYLHCWGGIGRTGTVVACYLIQHGLAGGSALGRLALLRQGTPDSHRRSPETDEQRAFVLSWEEQYVMKDRQDPSS